MSDSDDEVTLSTETLSILNQFLKEKDEIEKQQEVSDDISEDWQLSQFWYTKETSEFVANVIETETEGNKNVLCLSTPSIFKVLYRNSNPDIHSFLFEYDNRFSIYGDRFCFYDYKDPLGFPKDYENNIDYICFDPPFLSEECLEKVVETIKKLSKPTTKLLLMTGRIQWPHIQRLLPNMRICKFEPEHPRLQNDFFCCSSYDSELLGKEDPNKSNNK